MMDILVMINYIVWITVGITIIAGMVWSLYFQTRMTKIMFGEQTSKEETQEEEA